MTIEEREIILPYFSRDANGDTQIGFNSENMKTWGKLGLIPKTMVDYFYDRWERNQKEHGLFKIFKQKNPYATEEDIIKFFKVPRILTSEDSEQLQHDNEMQFAILNFMIENWETLLAAIASEAKPKLFREAEPAKNFGVAKVETDCVYHLRDLLDEMKARRSSSDDDYEARGEVKITNGLCVALEFDLKAKCQDDADSIVRNFQKMMLGRGLKTWLAFWKMANEKGRSHFECRISDVMSLLSGRNRESNFNDEERSEFWSIIRSLASTRFVMEWPIPKNKNGRTRWIQQPFLRIFGGEKELGDECPIRIGVEVLTEEIAAERFAPAFLVNGTLRLHPSDAHFALVIQSRAAQTGGGVIKWDWGHTFHMANVEGTARSNPRKAKAAVRKKLGTFRKEAIIEDWSEDPANVHIVPQKQLKKNTPKRRRNV